jgi:hypothetical protein
VAKPLSNIKKNQTKQGGLESMRNLKRYLAVVIAITMMLTSFVPFAMAAETTPVTDPAAAATKLNGMGLYKGISDSVFTPDLASSLKREEAVIILLRLAGVEQDALDMTSEEVTEALVNCTDTNTIAPWALKQVAYGVENEIIKGFPGVGEKFSFQPKGLLTTKQWSTLVLLQLEYAVPSFDNAPIQFAITTAATPEEIAAFGAEGIMNKGQVVGMAFKALSTKISGTTTTLIEQLVSTGNVTKEAAEEAGLTVTPVGPTATPTVAPTDITVTTVTATNGRLTVVMDKAIEPAPVAADFAVVKKVYEVADASVVATVYSYDSATKTAVLDFAPIGAAAADLKVTFTVAYKNGTPVTSNEVTVAAGFAIDTVTAINTVDGKTVNLEGATNVTTDKDRGFVVMFTRDLDTTTVNVNNFKVFKAGISQPLNSVELDDVNLKKVTVKVLSDLTDTTEYKLTIASAVKVKDATTLLPAAKEYTFTTGSYLHALIGSGNSFYDAIGTDVALEKDEAIDTGEAFTTTSKVTITFSGSIDSSTVGSSTVKMYNVTDNVQVPAVVAMLGGSSTAITVTPASNLLASKLFKVEVKGIKDLLGNEVYYETFNFTNDVSTGTFTVYAPNGSTNIDTDITPNFRLWPKLAAGTLDGSTSVQNGLILYATYSGSQGLNLNSVNSANITLKKWDTTANVAISTVETTLTYDSILKRILITPKADLEGGVTYKLVIEKELKDVFGKDALDADYEENIVTYDVTAPTLTSVGMKSGIAGATYTPIESGATSIDESEQLSLKFTFSEAIGFGDLTNGDPNNDADPLFAASTASAFAADRSILVYDASSSTISSMDPATFTVSRSSDKKDMYVTFPASRFTRNKTYVVAIAGVAGYPNGSTLTTGAAYDVLSDLTDNNIGAIGTYTGHNRLANTIKFAFTTRAADTTCPTVVSAKLDDNTTNLSGATLVDTASNSINVIFSEAIQITNATPITVTNTTDSTDYTLSWTALGGASLVNDAAFAAGNTTFTVDNAHGLTGGEIIRFGTSVYAVVKSVAGNVITLTNGASAAVADNTAVTKLVGVTISDASTDEKTMTINLATVNNGSAVTQDKATRLTLNTSIKDESTTPNALSSVTYNFVTGEAPEISTVGSYPALGEANVDTQALYIVLGINDALSDLDVNTLNATNITIKKASDSSVAPYVLTYVNHIKQAATFDNDLLVNDAASALVAGNTTVAYDGTDAANLAVGQIITFGTTGDYYVVTATTGTSMTIYPGLATGGVPANNSNIYVEQGVVYKKDVTTPDDTIKMTGNVQYNVSITGVKDIYGNQVDATVYNFLTENDAAPTATVTVGTTNITTASGFNIRRDDDITIQFSDDMLWSTSGTQNNTNLAWADTVGGSNSYVNTATNGLWSKTCYIRPYTGAAPTEGTETTPITAYYYYNDDTYALKIVPLSGQLAASTTYEIVLEKTVKGANGVAMNDDGGYLKYRFTTGTSGGTDSYTAKINESTKKVTLTFNYPVIAPTTPLDSGSATTSTLVLPTGAFIYSNSSIAGWTVSDDKQVITFTLADGATAVRDLVVGDTVGLGGIATPSADEIQKMTSTFATVALGVPFTGSTDAGDPTAVALTAQ